MTRRIHTAEFKQKVLQEVAKGATVKATADKHKLSRSLIQKWKKAPQAAPKAAPKADTELVELRQAVSKLEQEKTLLKEMLVDILKESA